MNGTEQRQHRSVTASLADRIDVLETLVADVPESVRAIIRQDRAFYAERFDAQRKLTDELAKSFLFFRHRTLWGRLKWLVTGT